MDARFCPRCGGDLAPVQAGGRERMACRAEGCGYVFWDNPAPVVAALVEHEGDVVLVRARGWPEGMFGLVTGFLERGETPEQGVLREVREELGLEGEVAGLIGVYAFELKHEVIMAWHVVARGTLVLGDELEEFRKVAPGKLRPWAMGTGLAVRDWIARR